MHLVRVLPLLLGSVALFGLPGGCVWIDEDDIAAFNDRDNDGLKNNEDCDDSNANVQGTVKFYPDVDGDGFGDMNAQAKEACPNEAPPNHVTDNTDCDDNNDQALPGGQEVCDLQDFDEDCDGAADDADADATGQVTWYPDADGDQFGDMNAAGVSACDPPTGTEVLDNTDCNDAAASVYPGGTEICDPDNNDEDCNGVADDLDGGVDPLTLIQYYDDGDSDGYGDPDNPGLVQCDPPGGQVDNAGDCDDADSAINPGATEVCDPADVDEDCNTLADDEDPGTDPTTMTNWYPDADGDSYGDSSAAPDLQCDPVGTDVADDTDCDDSRDDVHPYALEVCDLGMVDEDCDGLINDLDPDAAQSEWWPDDDGDGFGQLGPPAATQCLAPPYHADQTGDCDDTDDQIFPGAKEYHDSIDSDCDSQDWVCGNAYLRVGPAEVFTTIQSAVDAVDQITYCDGDTIEVLPGVYAEDLLVSGKSPNIVGLVGPGSTEIQGSGTTRAVSLDNMHGRFEGFSVSGGSVSGDGGGIRVFYGDGTILDDLIVSGNQATNGGGIELRNPTAVTLSNSTISGNNTTTGDGGGVRVSTTSDQSDGVILLSNLVVTGNTAGDAGGGIGITMDQLSSGASVIVEDTLLDGNTGVFAGGMWADDVPWLEVRRVDVIGNTGSANHGGMQVLLSTSLFEDVLFEGNTGVTVAGLSVQSYDNGPATLRDVVATDNILTNADGNGSTIQLKGDAANGSILERVEVARTVRTPGPFFGWGGGLSIEGKVTANNLLIYDETGPSGLFLAESISGTPADHSIANATVVGCDNDGVGVGAAIASNIFLTNVISAHNGGYGVNQSLLTAQVTYTDTFGNSLGDYAGTNHVGTAGNLDLDPTFVSYSAVSPSDTWDLTLLTGSVCIDAGDPAILDGDGSVSDMGYYGGPAAP